MLNRTTIEEANKHLQALYTKIQELEQVAHDQHEALVAKDSFIQTKLGELATQDVTISRQTDEIQQRDEAIDQKNQTIAVLEASLQTKQQETDLLGKRSDTLEKVLSLIPELRAVMSKFNHVSASTQEEDGVTGVPDSGSTSPNSADADNTVQGKTSPLRSRTESEGFNLSSPKLLTKDTELFTDEDEKPIADSAYRYSENNTKPKEIYF